LEALRDRLIAIRDRMPTSEDLVERLITDEEIEEDLLDEILDPPSSDEETQQRLMNEVSLPVEPALERQKLLAEIDELTRYAQWARSIGIDTKARALIKALEIGFKKMTEMGAAQRAVIFTESRRTQAYLKEFLEANGYAGRVISFNGTNREPETTAIYERWLEANKENGRATGVSACGHSYRYHRALPRSRPDPYRDRGGWRRPQPPILLAGDQF